MEKKELNELIKKANEADNQIWNLKSENRTRMCEAIVEIVKEHGGKITADEWEGVLEDEAIEITFISEDGTYYNDFCEVQSIETFEMHDGKLNFTICCDDADDYAEWNMSYEIVAAIYYALVEWFRAMENEE